MSKPILFFNVKPYHMLPQINSINTLDYRLTNAMKAYDAKVARKDRIGHCAALLKQIYKRYIYFCEAGQASKGSFITYLSVFVEGFTLSERTTHRQLQKLANTPFLKKIRGWYKRTSFSEKQKFSTRIVIDEKLIDYVVKPLDLEEEQPQTGQRVLENSMQLSLDLSPADEQAEVDKAMQYFNAEYEKMKNSPQNGFS